MSDFKAGLLIIIATVTIVFSGEAKAAGHRKTWVDMVEKVCTPVLENLSKGTLRKNMPVETNNNNPESIQSVTHLEALGRTLTGIAPWMELGPDQTKEGKVRARFINMTLLALKNAVDPQSEDCLNFSEGKQPLVDAAFLAHGLLRSRNQIWNRLDSLTQRRMIEALKSTRVIKPHENNWLLFSAMVECALKVFDGEWNYERVEYAINKHNEWYKGDGWYGDGPNFHLDYYNSFVIQPMLIQVLDVVNEQSPDCHIETSVYHKRYARYAEQLERLISPEGTFPAFGRSLPYRFGAFYALSDAVYRQLLPTALSPAQVRCGLTAVMKRQMSVPGTFDKNGWLTVGFAGHQPSIGERYISTGSVYLCCAVFVALGLPEDSEFWQAPDCDWTQKKIWKGLDVPCDKILKESKRKLSRISLAPKQESMEELTDRVFDRAAAQFTILDKKLDSVAVSNPGKSVYPRSIKKDGKLWTGSYKLWVSGFFPGSLWLIYDYTSDQRFKNLAMKYQSGLEPLRYRTDDHDIGFQLMCSYGNCLRLTQEESCKEVLIDGAHSLASRFNLEVGCTRSWDFGDWKFPVIIDNMMNMELFLKAAELSGDSSLRDIALSHARTTMKNHFREDYSCFHLVNYDPVTGDVIGRQTVQGYADDSAWARGQSWALHSYTMIYRFTQEKEFLHHAVSIAEYLLKRIPEDHVPYWDYDAPDIPDAVKDASAGALMASALIELSTYVNKKQASEYLDKAEKIIRALASPKYLAEEGEIQGFLLKHSTGHNVKKYEVDKPLSYADYYFLEALLRWRNLKK